ncbi:hypothetical protein [Fimbriiglobus ruber]|uniref:Carboxypeptidase regulatory-like domain-containing protein n=1 Tax=Fimbriiglobus ruber TaxID=1908690 RepID=A0A225DFP0_9BACT|nr:hypothetical protein [Fimbriiglobus ruber]OWK38464.1 hypothetical protein FRUB_07584 [Fimbriiglobus ruber]
MRQFVGPLGTGFVSACVFAFLSGCGAGKLEGGVRVEGKLVKASKPFVVTDSAQVLSLAVTGTNAKGEATSYPATINASDGSFVIPGPANGGVPPGKYKISMSLTAPMGNSPAELEKAAALNKQFAMVNGQEFEVGSDGVQSFTIDTGTGAVYKGNK